METRCCRNCKYGNFREDVGYYCTLKDEVFLSIEEYTEKNKCKNFRREYSKITKLIFKAIITMSVISLLLILL